ARSGQMDQLPERLRESRRHPRPLAHRPRPGRHRRVLCRLRTGGCHFPFGRPPLGVWCRAGRNPTEPPNTALTPPRVLSPPAAPVPPQLPLRRACTPRWIAPPKPPPPGYGVYYSRRTFDLPTKPDRFVVHVSGDNRYQLYVNGRRIAWGPARGDLFHWRYETV